MRANDNLDYSMVAYMRGSRKFCKREVQLNSDSVFSVDEGREDPNNTKAGHYRPASELLAGW